MKISILVTTFKRSTFLKNCINSLLSQTRLPDKIIIVARDNDFETLDIINEFMKNNPNIICKTVNKSGVLPANNEGLKVINEDIVCFIDDDAIAENRWIEKIEKYFNSDKKIGAVGGRDIAYNEKGEIITKTTKLVGKVTWYGNFIGNHHLLSKGQRYVDFLKGCNMSFRRKLIDFCDETIGGDAEYYEVDLCLSMKEKGYRILYDPDITVKHFYAPRYISGGRNNYSKERLYYIQYNKGYVALKKLSFLKKIIFLIIYLFFDSFKISIKSVLRKNINIFKYSIFGKFGGIISYLNKKN